MDGLANKLFKDMKNYYIEYNNKKPKNGDDVLRFMYSHASIVADSMDMIKRYDQYDMISLEDYPTFIQHLFTKSLLPCSYAGFVEDIDTATILPKYSNVESICKQLNYIMFMQDSPDSHIIIFSNFKRQFSEYWKSL